MPAAQLIEAANILEDGGFGLVPGFPRPAPGQLGLDGLEERLNNVVDTPVSDKQEFDVILLRRVRCRLRAGCTF